MTYTLRERLPFDFETIDSLLMDRFDGRAKLGNYSSHDAVDGFWIIGRDDRPSGKVLYTIETNVGPGVIGGIKVSGRGEWCEFEIAPNESPFFESEFQEVNAVHVNIFKVWTKMREFIFQNANKSKSLSSDLISLSELQPCEFTEVDTGSILSEWAKKFTNATQREKGKKIERKEKRGRKTLPDEEKLDLLQKWDLIDKNTTTFEEFLRVQLPGQNPAYSMYCKQTVHGWRRQLRKKGLY